MIRGRLCSVVVSTIVLHLLSLPAGRADESDTRVFETNAVQAPADEAPVIHAWRQFVVDRQFGGVWVVAGDVDGDRQLDVVSARNVNERDDHYTSAVVAQRLDGSRLWTWGDPDVGRSDLHHDVACQIHDVDQDGTSEVILAADRRIVVLKGHTGKTLRSFAIPEHASDCVVFADLSGKGWPTEILVKNRYQQIWAYRCDGKLLWTSQTPGGYRTAHQPWPVDLDGDGRDEILAGYAALNSDGSVRWVFQADDQQPNQGHADCWRVVKLAADPSDTRLVMTMCGGNALVMTDGNGRLLWRQTGHHYESVDVGKIGADVPGQQMVVDIDHLPRPPKPLCLFTDQGQLLGRINTEYSRHHVLIDWDGDGIEEIGAAVARGLFDGQGRRMARFHIGAEEEPRLIAAVDTCGQGPDAVMLSTEAADGNYRVYLYRSRRDSNSPTGIPLGTGLNFTLY